MRSNQWATARYKGEPGPHQLLSSPGCKHSTMLGPCSLRLLLLLQLLAACSPLLDREEPGQRTLAGPMTRAHVAGAHRDQGGTAQWLRAARAPALLSSLSGREQAGFRVPSVRREDQEAPDFLPADGEKAPGPLGTLVEGLQGYGRKKGGFSFRFGRG